jgi:hypothetical protein
MFIKPDIDPFNNNKKLDPFGCNLYKHNWVIMSKEILKHTKQYIEDDVLEWVIQKCFSGVKIWLLGYFEYNNKFILLLFV